MKNRIRIIALLLALILILGGCLWFCLVLWH